MIKKIKHKEVMKRLEQLQNVMSIKSSEVVIVDLEKWLNSDVECAFDDYIHKIIEKKSDNCTIIIDNMLLETSMYLHTELLYSLNQVSMKEFIDAASDGDDIKCMTMYVELFKKIFELDDKPSKEYCMTSPKLNFLHDSTFENGKLLTDDEVRKRHFEFEMDSYNSNKQVYSEIFQEQGCVFYEDLLKNHDLMTIPELVERYKDQKWFEGRKSHV